MKEPKGKSLPVSTIVPRPVQKGLNSALISILAVTLVAAASFALYVHNQLGKRASHLSALEAAVQHASRTAAAYHHLTDLTEQRRQTMNKSLDALQIAQDKLQNSAPVGFATVISDRLDQEGHAYRYDDIVQYAQRNLPGDEFAKLNVTLNPMVKRSDEFSDAVHAASATLRAFVANPWSMVGQSGDKFWDPFHSATKAIHDAFSKYQAAVYNLQGAADQKLATTRGALRSLQNKSWTDSLRSP